MPPSKPIPLGELNGILPFVSTSRYLSVTTTELWTAHFEGSEDAGGSLETIFEVARVPVLLSIATSQSVSTSVPSVKLTGTSLGEDRPPTAPCRSAAPWHDAATLFERPRLRRGETLDLQSFGDLSVIVVTAHDVPAVRPHQHQAALEVDE